MLNKAGSVSLVFPSARALIRLGRTLLSSESPKPVSELPVSPQRLLLLVLLVLGLIQEAAHSLILLAQLEDKRLKA